MAAGAAEARDADCQIDISQLRGLAESMDEEVFRPLRAEDLGPDVPRRLMQMRRLVDDAIERAAGQDERIVDRRLVVSRGRENYAYGWEFALCGARAWLGVWNEAWRRGRDTPIWLSFRPPQAGDRPIEEVRERLSREAANSKSFDDLWGRALQLIDCQNLFCEVDKYARAAHPEVRGLSGRTRIKQRFSPRTEPITAWYPPKWGINEVAGEWIEQQRKPRQLPLV